MEVQQACSYVYVYSVQLGCHLTLLVDWQDISLCIPRWCRTAGRWEKGAEAGRQWVGEKNSLERKFTLYCGRWEKGPEVGDLETVSEWGGRE